MYYDDRDGWTLGGPFWDTVHNMIFNTGNNLLFSNNFASGVSVENSLIIGDGAKQGLNWQGFSKGKGSQKLYGYDIRGKRSAIGLDVGISLTGNYAFGYGGKEGWYGCFDTLTLNIQPGLTVTCFTSDSWTGIDFGFGYGLPGFSYAQTTYW